MLYLGTDDVVEVREGRLVALAKARHQLGEINPAEPLYSVVEALLEILDDIIERKFV